MTSALTHPLRLLLVIAALIALLLIGGAGSAGAAAEDTIDLPFEPITIDYDDSTNHFVLSEGNQFSTCEDRRLHIADHTGALQWQVPGPVPCHWLLHDGTLFVSSHDTIRHFDLTTGELLGSWELAQDRRALEMFRAGPSLYFNEEVFNGNLWLPSGVASLVPSVPDSLGTGALGDVRLIAASDSARFLWIVDRFGVITRFDQDGQTDLIEMPTSDRIGGFSSNFYLSADEQLLFGGGRPVLMIDSATLEVVGQVGQSSQGNPGQFEQRTNGQLVGVGGTLYGGSARIYNENSLESIATGGYVQDPDRGGNLATFATVIQHPTRGELLAMIAESRIELLAIAPELGGLHDGDIDANNPRTVRMGVDWIDAVETISVDGQSLVFDEIDTDFNGTTDWFEVDLPSLSQGRHLVTFDGPLGQSLDIDANYLTVTPARSRTQLDIVVRADSGPGEVTVSVNCQDPNGSFDQPIDISTSEVLRAGGTLTYQPLIGNTCRISYERVESADLPLGYFGYLTGGFFDPVSDPNAWGMLDFETRMVEFDATSSAVGFGVFLPAADEVVLWTYAYGFGQIPAGERTITIDCEGTANDTTYRIYYGYWYRSVVPAQGCMLEHPAPTGSAFSGWGEYVPELRELQPVRSDYSRRSVGSGPLSTLFTLDVYPHPSEHNGAFARQQYLDFLGRKGDPGGLRFWEDALNSGSKQRTDLVQLFLDSTEFGGTVAPVSRLYQAYFDRAPDRDGLFFWVNWIRDGRTLGQVSDEFARSPEFMTTYGCLSDEDFIDLVYTNVLGRPADAAGRAFWVDEMADGLTRGQLMANFSESPEYIEQTSAAVLVESLYQGLLQRSPDPEGFAYWTGQVEAGASIDSLISGMLSSDEYFNRFDNIIDELPTGNASQVANGEQLLLAVPPLFQD